LENNEEETRAFGSLSYILNKSSNWFSTKTQSLVKTHTYTQLTLNSMKQFITEEAISIDNKARQANIY